MKLKKAFVLCSMFAFSMLAERAFAETVVQGGLNPSCPQFAPFGYPAAVDKKVVRRAFHICRKAYSAYFDPATKTPLWVAEKITADSADGAEPRTNDFREDPDLPRGASPKLDDYKRQGLPNGRRPYDRGHMAPAANFMDDSVAMSESFYLSNMVPQDPQSNRSGPWRKLETKTRYWAKSRGSIYVISGPIYKDGERSETIGKSRVMVPSHLYKVVIDAQRGMAVAFIVPNAPTPSGELTAAERLMNGIAREFGMARQEAAEGGKSRRRGSDDQAQILSKHTVSIRDVENATGLDFNPALNPSDSERLEARDKGMWNR